jgi:hypothetical protein
MTKTPNHNITVGQTSEGKPIFVVNDSLYAPHMLDSIEEAKKLLTQKEFDTSQNKGYRYAPWGQDNLEPTNRRIAVMKVPLAARAIQKLVEMMYGRGLGYVKNEDIAKDNLAPAYNPDIEKFLVNSQIRERWLPNIFFDYLLQANTFSECDTDLGGQIVSLYHKDAEYTRIGRQDEKDGYKIKDMYFAPQFAIGHWMGDYYPDFMASMPLYRWYEHDTFFEELSKNGKTKFGIHTGAPTPGTTYYARVLWDYLWQDENWLAVAARAPKVAFAMMAKQARWKYKIVIPDLYFEARYEDWGSLSPTEKNEKIKAKLKEIDDVLGNPESVIQNILQYAEQNPDTGELFGEIKIEAIDDKFKTGTWIPDASVANFEILNAIGLNPNQMELPGSQGKSMGAGSGSNTRVSFNLHILNNTLDQLVCLGPLNLISRQRGWDVTFYMRNDAQVTQNVDKTGIATEQKKGEKKAKKKSDNALKDNQDDGAVQ